MPAPTAPFSALSAPSAPVPFLFHAEPIPSSSSPEFPGPVASTFLVTFFFGPCCPSDVFGPLLSSTGTQWDPQFFHALSATSAGVDPSPSSSLACTRGFRPSGNTFLSSITAPTGLPWSLALMLVPYRHIRRPFHHPQARSYFFPYSPYLYLSLRPRCPALLARSRHPRSRSSWPTPYIESLPLGS